MTKINEYYYKISEIERKQNYHNRLSIGEVD